MLNGFARRDRRPQRHFRPVLWSLEERWLPSVQLGGEFGSMQFAPDGSLNYLFWNGDDLTYEHRGSNGIFAGEVVAHEADFSNPPPAHRGNQAQLVYAADSTPNVFYLHNGVNVAHYRRGASGWSLAEDLSPPTTGAGFEYFTHLVAATGPGGRFHLALLDHIQSSFGSGAGTGALVYGTSAGGAWSFQKVADTGDPQGFFKQSYEPRFFSLAVDPDNFAHLSYCPGFFSQQNADGTLHVYSSVAYASNRGGAWTAETVYDTGTGNDDAGLGACVAIGPGGQVAMASFLDRRVSSGSPISSQLLYHTRQANGTWATETVATVPDGYVAGDGPHYTGFAPQLIFDAAGKPVIFFSDHASQHFTLTGADEFAGQTRLAVRGVSGWSLSTLFAQTDPVHNMVVYPTMALQGGELATVFIREVDTTDANGQVTSITYTLELRGYAAGPLGLTGGSVTIPPAGRPYAAGTGPGTPALVKFFNSDGTLRFTLAPYANFGGGVRVATGDVDGDGLPDVITAPGPGGGPHIRIFSGVDGHLFGEYMAYNATFAGGVFVAAGDINGDGFADIITGADAGGGPHVKVFDGRTGGLLRSFLAYGASFTGGVRVGAGDVDQDGKADIITGAGPGGGPHVEVFSGATGALIRSFFAYTPSFVGGVFVSGGDVDGDGKADIVTGAGAGGGPHVQVFSGSNGAVLRSFFSGDPAFTGGVTVAARDRDGDGKADIVTGPGPSSRPTVRSFQGLNGTQRNEFAAFDPTFLGGVFVG